MWQISKMAKRKTFKTMDTDERLAVRREMVKEAEALIRHNFPDMRLGTVRIRAHQFVEDSIAKEFGNAQVPRKEAQSGIRLQ